MESIKNVVNTHKLFWKCLEFVGKHLVTLLNKDWCMHRYMYVFECVAGHSMTGPEPHAFLSSIHPPIHLSIHLSIYPINNLSFLLCLSWQLLSSFILLSSRLYANRVSYQSFTSLEGKPNVHQCTCLKPFSWCATTIWLRNTYIQSQVTIHSQKNHQYTHVMLLFKTDLDSHIAVIFVRRNREFQAKETGIEVVF